MSEWKIASGRVSLFPPARGSSAPFSAHDLYRLVWGTEPNIFQKTQNPLMPTLARGDRGGILATCSVHPTRVDFNLSGNENTESAIPTIDDGAFFGHELGRVVSVLSKQNPIDLALRVAIGLHFLVVSSSIGEANTTLLKAIPHPYSLNLNSEEDVIFQVNRPYDSQGQPRTRMNFVSKWSVNRLQVLTIAIPVGRAGMQPSITNPQPAEYIVANAEFDINSPAKSPSLSKSRQTELLREALLTGIRFQKQIGISIRGLENGNVP